MINPEGLETTYFFEYGTTTAYGTSLPATQDADAGSAYAIESELQRVDGLQPGTTYHYRLVATNAVGTTRGADQSFTTGTPPAASAPRPGIPGSGFLPDDRGWEKISPNDKNGGDIMIDAGRTQIAPDGSAARMSSLSPFGDAVGTSVATDYLSVRDATQGWSTHAITPRQEATTFTGVLHGLQGVYTALTRDLSTGVFIGWSPVTPDPNVANVINLYLRDDARSAGAGSYQLITACPLCASTSTPLPPLLGNVTGNGTPRFAGASSDGNHLIFESQQPLTTDAAGNCSDLRDIASCPGKLYEWDHGTVRLVGILPDSSCGSPPCVSPGGSQAGQGAGAFQNVAELTPHTISADGSRIFFTVPDSPGSTSGALYMRANHTTTVQLNTSERTDCADHDPCAGGSEPDPGGMQSAIYWDASADGLRGFFTTTEALTDDAAPSGENKLYMYDASKPVADPHNLTLISVDQQPADPAFVHTVLGVSNNGRYVYFAAFGRLLTGQRQPANRFLYVWHDGTIREVAPMGDFPDDPEDTNTSSWSFTPPTARVTPDGLRLLFSYTGSSTGPTGYDQGHCNTLGSACREFYLYSYVSQRLACVSCNPSGAPATTAASIGARIAGGSVTSPAQNHPLTDDGRRVFFSTAEASVPQDVNGRIDVYEYDVPAGTLHLISTGTDPSDSYFMDASPSGNDVVLLTRAKLSARDDDNNYDAYDTRVGGGFTEPSPARADCAGDTCQGPQTQAPTGPRISSDVVSGSARRSPVTSKRKIKPKKKAKHCRRGYVRKRVRGKTTCVKKHKPHKRKRSLSPRRVK